MLGGSMWYEGGWRLPSAHLPPLSLPCGILHRITQPRHSSMSPCGAGLLWRGYFDRGMRDW